MRKITIIHQKMLFEFTFFNWIGFHFLFLKPLLCRRCPITSNQKCFSNFIEIMEIAITLPKIIFKGKVFFFFPKTLFSICEKLQKDPSWIGLMSNCSSRFIEFNSKWLIIVKNSNVNSFKHCRLLCLRNSPIAGLTLLLSLLVSDFFELRPGKTSATKSDTDVRLCSIHLPPI